MSTRRAAPFLKWAGGKGRLLEQYRAFFPPGADIYYEPFTGSAAVFFALRNLNFARRYRLFDINPELINVYRVVRDEIDGLIALLRVHSREHSREAYARIRGMDRAADWPQRSDVERAARMIYLNKTCYNGLWRVNRRGWFNVPMGRYANPPILDEPRLRAASEALQGVEMAVCGFREAVAEAGPQDFVYFDPPYQPVSATANFTDYAADRFGEAEQRALADVYRDLSDRGCRAMLSNSDTPLVRDLYAGFDMRGVQARRAINSSAEKRGPVTEVVVLNY